MNYAADEDDADERDVRDVREHETHCRSARLACAEHLLDLRQHELWPDQVPNPDIDRR